MSQEWFCLEHGLPIISFCISKHNCPDRRLCYKCFYSTHSNFDKNQIPLLDDFQKQLQGKLSGYQMKQPCNLLKQIKYFQDQVNQTFLDIQQSAQFLLKNFEDIDQNISEMKLKIETYSFLNLFETDKDLMIGIVRDNLLEEMQIEQHHFRNKLKTIEELLRSTVEKCIKQLLQFTNSNSKEKIEEYYFQLHSNITLEGLKVMGLRFGDYYYCYENGTRELAGSYKLDNNNGIQKVYCGQKYKPYKINSFVGYIQKKQMIFKTLNYKDGLQLSNFQKEGQLDSNNKFVELFGCDSQIKFKGEVLDNLKNGQWQYFFEDEMMYLKLLCSGGGEFDKQGKKTGKWIECNDMYNKYCLVIYSGEYKNGLPFGEWTTLYKSNKIGGGNYDEKGVKQGNWTDLVENFWDGCQVTYSGEYKNGLRLGEWNIFYRDKKIRGGLYNDQGNKFGQWVELHNNFWDFCHVIYQGEYRNGVQQGQWNTFFLGAKIGGGNYNGQGLKVGLWIELPENFYSGCQVLNSGQYRNGLRFSNWTTSYNGKKIGGGNYDEKGRKQGVWTELHENFNSAFQVLYIGKYANGIRFGLWITKYNDEKIGGGNYDYKGVKTGNWTEIYENNLDQIVYSGEYKNGVKLGQWKEMSLKILELNRTTLIAQK